MLLIMICTALPQFYPPFSLRLQLTSAWPETVMRCSHLPFTGSKGGRRLHHTLPILDDLSRQLKPRYHFAVGEEVFFQREPYRNRARDGRPMGAAGTERGIEDAGEAAVTRFVGLADFGNAKKERVRVCTWRCYSLGTDVVVHLHMPVVLCHGSHAHARHVSK